MSNAKLIMQEWERSVPNDTFQHPAFTVVELQQL